MDSRNIRRGFTFAELLIVVAIIGVLAAISIPVFARLLAGSRASADAAMIRSGYAQAATAALDNDVSSEGVYYLQTDGSIGSGQETLYTCVGSYEDFSNQEGTIGTTLISSIAWEKGDKIIYVYDPDDQSITISTQLSADKISAKNAASVTKAVSLAIEAWEKTNEDYENGKTSIGIICTYTIETGACTIEYSSSAGVSGIFTKASDLEGYLTSGSMTRKDGSVYTVKETSTHGTIVLNESIVKTWTIYVSAGRVLGYSATI